MHTIHLARRTLVAALGAAALALSAPALASQTPNSLAGVTVVGADQVKKLIDSGVPVIDTRVANEYAEKTIKGAKSVPYKEKSSKAVDFDASQDGGRVEGRLVVGALVPRRHAGVDLEGPAHAVNEGAAPRETPRATVPRPGSGPRRGARRSTESSSRKHPP